MAADHKDHQVYPAAGSPAETVLLWAICDERRGSLVFLLAGKSQEYDWLVIFRRHLVFLAAFVIRIEHLGGKGYSHKKWGLS